MERNCYWKEHMQGAWPSLSCDCVNYTGFGEGLESLCDLEIQRKMGRKSNTESDEAEVKLWRMNRVSPVMECQVLQMPVPRTPQIP